MRKKSLEYRDKILEIKESVKKTVRDINSKDLSFTLVGFTLGVVIMASLSYAGFGFQADSSKVLENKVNKETAGEKAVNMLNTRVLHNTPNNVTSELVEVEDAGYRSLPNFYEVTLEVRNPTARQQTKIFVKKDASLLFLNYPKYIDKELYRNQQHQ